MGGSLGEPLVQRQQKSRWGWSSQSVGLQGQEDSQCHSQVVKEVGGPVQGAEVGAGNGGGLPFRKGQKHLASSEDRPL